jgi:hypothetical protein
MQRILRELTDEELNGELERRKLLRAGGHCDYCGKKGDASPCNAPERHRIAEFSLKNLKASGQYQDDPIAGEES